jgi:hypothetical protein
MKRALAGGSATALATQEFSPEYIAIDANNVYWSNYPPQPPNFNSVPIAGGMKTQVASGDPLTNSVEFTLDSSKIYWAGFSGGQGGVWSTPLGGGSITPLTMVNTNASDAAVFGGNIYFLAGSQTVPPTVKKVSASGGTASDIVAGSASRMSVDATGIYLGGTTPPGGVNNSITRVSFDGATVNVLAVASSALYAFAVGATDVFWVDSDGLLKATSKTP